MGRYGKLKEPVEGMRLKIVGDRIKHGNYGGLMRCSRRNKIKNEKRWIKK